MKEPGVWIIYLIFLMVVLQEYRLNGLRGGSATLVILGIVAWVSHRQAKEEEEGE